MWSTASSSPTPRPPPSPPPPTRRAREGTRGRQQITPAWPTQPRRPALRTGHSPDPHPPRYPPPNPQLPRQPPPAPPRPTRQRGAPHRTNDGDADQAPAHPSTAEEASLDTEGGLSGGGCPAE